MGWGARSHLQGLWDHVLTCRAVACVGGVQPCVWTEVLSSLAKW